MRRVPVWLQLLGWALVVLVTIAVGFFMLAAFVASAIKYPGIPALFILIWLICGSLFDGKERGK